jgi:hypothetical protein
MCKSSRVTLDTLSQHKSLFLIMQKSSKFEESMLEAKLAWKSSLSKSSRITSEIA